MSENNNSKSISEFPQLEARTLDFWEKSKIFEQTLNRTAQKGDYAFYDGPPFATGTPHYGHIVASLMKDVVPRYKTMNGYRVERRWGWDCHGLPIENIVEKELGFATKKEIVEFGIDKFNERCRQRVLEYAAEWEKTVKRLGRWVDMKNGYKTMDLPFMESVWWVFKTLYDQGLIYEGYRSMHICPRCETTLSQSEVAEGYKDIKDLSTVAKFKLKANPTNTNLYKYTNNNTYVLAWTTTPWTLIGNVALAVGKEIDYALVELDTSDDNSQLSISNDQTIPNDQIPNRFIVAKLRTDEVFKNHKIKIVKELKGAELVGLEYEPLFDYYAKDEKLKNRENGWKIYNGDFVTTEEGTGVVHVACAFGEDDLNLGKEYDLPFVQHVGLDGIIKDEAGEFAGLSVKPIDDHTKTDVAIIKYLANKGLLFDKAKFEHSYPHCWRCDTPLLNYATGSWFVKVSALKEQAVREAEAIHWFPEHIKAGRFGQWLEGARDWSISRQRFWASVIPLWKCSGCDKTEVFGSVKELEAASQTKIDDLHKHLIDKVEYACACGGTMRRIPDVLDTWFDSGSMTFAQHHYPFENKEKLENNFPAQFIAEGVDQTRAWFYYLHLLAVAVKGKNAFSHAIVNGIVLSEDGKKMSKKLKNYPDPNEIMDLYGADALRIYLLTAPVMQAENLNFSAQGVAETLRKYLMIYWNVYKFYEIYRLDRSAGSFERPSSETVLERWILLKLDALTAEVSYQMEQYNLPKAVRPIGEFIDELSTWFLRRSRQRLKDGQGAELLAYLLQETAKLLAPFAPFAAENVWQSVTGYEYKQSEKSVHLASWPQPVGSPSAQERRELEMMEKARKVVELGLKARDEAKIKVRQPLNQLRIKNCELGMEYSDLLKDELNIKNIVCIPGEGELSVELDTTLTPDLLADGLERELVRQINMLRKNSGLTVKDRIVIRHNAGAYIQKIIVDKKQSILDASLADDIVREDAEIANGQEINLAGTKFSLGIKII